MKVEELLRKTQESITQHEVARHSYSYVGKNWIGGKNYPVGYSLVILMCAKALKA